MESGEWGIERLIMCRLGLGATSEKWKYRSIALNPTVQVITSVGFRVESYLKLFALRSTLNPTYGFFAGLLFLFNRTGRSSVLT